MYTNIEQNRKLENNDFILTKDINFVGFVNKTA